MNRKAIDPKSMDLYDEAGLYCAAFDWPVDREVDWLLRQVPGARRVLEPFCGNARHARVFVERGLEYWGVERSAAMLKRAADGAHIHLVQADAREFSIPGAKFDLAWCPINSIRHLLTDEDLASHLRTVRSHLSRDGVYVVESDLTRRDGWRTGPMVERGIWTMPQPDGTIIDCRWQPERDDLARRRVFERATIIQRRGTDVLREVSNVYEMRMLTFEDWRGLIARSGFTVSAVFEHRGSVHRPQVEFSVGLENGPDNYYFVLRPMGERVIR
ncbi:MAG: class I SAM-dependent methyltransferase [Phycisphaerales bacterium]|nr:class I SAM-dependent methyltransferase [Phycisphaerales bacterium]